MQYTFKPRGVCAAKISFDIDDGVVKNVSFYGGCSGNTQGIAKLCEGRKAEEIIQNLDGIRCGFKNTSCPDQLAKALKKAIEE